MRMKERECNPAVEGWQRRLVVRERNIPTGDAPPNNDVCPISDQAHGFRKRPRPDRQIGIHEAD